MKIEIDIPDGEYCSGCIMLSEGVIYHEDGKMAAVCNMHKAYVYTQKGGASFKKCETCINAMIDSR